MPLNIFFALTHLQTASKLICGLWYDIKLYFMMMMLLYSIHYHLICIYLFVLFLQLSLLICIYFIFLSIFFNNKGIILLLLTTGKEPYYIRDNNWQHYMHAFHQYIHAGKLSTFRVNDPTSRLLIYNNTYDNIIRSYNLQQQTT